MKKIGFIILVFLLADSVSQAQEPTVQGDWKELFAGPKQAADRTSWAKTMEDWRSNELKRLSYDGSIYMLPQLKWLKKTFIYAQMMAHDRYFYNPVTRKYTVDKYLADLESRYGGIDAVLIWPTYPNIGVDNRNQYDLLHDMPGGISAIKKMVSDFKKRGVAVFFPIMIWDHGTRKISLPMPEALIAEMKELGADGLNGDTMDGVTIDFKNAFESADYPMVLQPEIRIKDLKMVEWNTSSWGYYWNYSFVPGVSIYKWLEPRHQVFVTNRWVTNRTDDIQYAFFNGVGYNSWENIWGVWNQISERDAEAIRRISTIYHQFAGIWNSPNWQPHVPTLKYGIFASKFPGQEKTIYTFVNRDSVAHKGHQIKLQLEKGMQYFDLWNGVELNPIKEKDSIYVDFEIDAHGYGALLAVRKNAMNKSILSFLNNIKKSTIKPFNTLSTIWEPLLQQIVKIAKTKSVVEAPEGMVPIPAIENYEFKTNGVMIEGDNLASAIGVQHTWQSHPQRSDKHVMAIASFFIDKYPVTNAQFKKFIDATHYWPKDNHNFLKDWKDGQYPSGWDMKPVTWVSIEDAREYAIWAGKRLPHEWEWQYAAQGNDKRVYPWGNMMDATKLPPIDSSRTMRPATNVDSFLAGASPFGVIDLVGNVWQFTDEYTDAHTRAAILKGGGFYRPLTSDWYFPRAYEVNKYGKYLLMAASLDRSATIGFRCVIDR